MSLSDQINQALRRQREATFKLSPQLSLGELISQLESIEIRSEDQPVYFDFEYLAPTCLSSWRGSYSELAIEFSANSATNSLSKVIAMLKNAIGATFEGYKGGDFIMTNNTPVWVANYGNSGNTGVVGVLDLGYKVVIQTAYCDF